MDWGADMKGLMELLAKSGSDEPSETASDSADLDTTAAPDSTAAFDDSASQAMDAIKSGDPAAFADALRACIEMSR